MKNYRDSDYAANKYASGIVYRFANQIIEVTLADYLRENPGKTEVDFTELKALSDEMYLEQVRSDTAQGKKTVSLHALEETWVAAALSPEDTLIAVMTETERRQYRLGVTEAALGKLTETQRRRYLLHVVQGMTTRKIAEIDGVSHQSVVECLAAAQKKINKVLANG